MLDFAFEAKREQYLLTIKNLRLRNFGNNLPFLLLSENLPKGQVYREYPDGSIEIQEVATVGNKFTTRVVKILKGSQADHIRRTYGLL